MSRSWDLFLRDMLESARKITRFIAGCQLETFVANEMMYDAVLYKGFSYSAPYEDLKLKSAR